MGIEIRTGLPGAGKTLFLVDHLLRFRKEFPDRPVYALNIKGLRQGIAIPTTVDEFRNWQNYPVGSLIVVDEIQEFIPSRRSGEPAGWVAALSTHRHLGLDFIFATQDPSYIDTYLRRLCDSHLHHVRLWRSHWSRIFRWPQCEDQPKLRTVQKAAEHRSVRRFPSAAMAAYTSSQMHTQQQRIPPYVWAGLVGLVVVPALGYLGMRFMRGIGTPKVAGKSLSSASLGLGAGAAPAHVLTPAEYVRHWTPRIASIPWSAPAYDSQKPVAIPRALCIAVVHADGTHCLCYTQQATRLALPFATCMAQVHDGGTFDPYIPDARLVGSRLGRVATGRAAPESGDSAGVVSPSDGAVATRWPSSAIHHDYTPPQALSGGPDASGGAGVDEKGGG